MASRVHQRRQARADLDRIWTYIAANNTKAADAMLERIRSVYKMLVQNPLAGRRRPEFGRNLRSFSFDNYLVFYIPQSGAIDTGRVMHGRQDVGPADMA